MVSFAVIVSADSARTRESGASSKRINFDKHSCLTERTQSFCKGVPNSFGSAWKPERCAVALRQVIPEVEMFNVIRRDFRAIIR
jgi:hypothetical protein